MHFVREQYETVYINGIKASSQDLARLAEDMRTGRVTVVTVAKTSAGNWAIRIAD